MAQTIAVQALPDTVTLLDNTIHTIDLQAGFDLGGYEPFNYQTLFIKVVLAATTIKFNNSGDPALSNKAFVTGDEFFITVNKKFPLRVLGALNDQFEMYS